ncbi:hypothetical protein [Leptospira santarosai]|uniref:hypothetical protein n=1 Tax=Leptospira santarosai TaxID=28183 RepID=UPI0031FCDC61
MNRKSLLRVPKFIERSIESEIAKSRGAKALALCEAKTAIHRERDSQKPRSESVGSLRSKDSDP